MFDCSHSVRRHACGLRWRLDTSLAADLARAGDSTAAIGHNQSVGTFVRLGFSSSIDDNAAVRADALRAFTIRLSARVRFLVNAVIACDPTDESGVAPVDEDAFSRALFGRLDDAVLEAIDHLRLGG